MKDGGESLIFLNQSKRDVAKYALSKVDVRFNSIPDKHSFFDETHYESLMERKASLGL